MGKILGGLTFIAAAGAAVLFAVLYLPELGEMNYESSATTVVEALPEEETFKVIHIETPKELKAIYMTACVASDAGWRKSLKDLINSTELNSVVIDIKDFTGKVSFPGKFPQSDDARGCLVPDMKEFIGELHESRIYVIGRISVFQDVSYTKIFPELAVKKQSDGEVWKDRKGLSFVDVGAKPYWDYIISLSKSAYEIGFDELNYDYVRYPSDGNMQDIKFEWTSASTTKPVQLEEFFSYLHSHMKNTGAVLSADLFGMTTTAYSDMGIGQILERALPYFDYIAPMVYPSHYPKTWNGFANPAEHPYEVIKISMGKAVEREAAWRTSIGLATSTPSKMRPWLQDFDLGATYDADKVRAQIQATYDVGLTSWMLWSAANRYTRGALLEE